MFYSLPKFLFTPFYGIILSFHDLSSFPTCSFRLTPSNMLNLSFGRKLRGTVSAAPPQDCFLPQTHTPNLLRREDGHHSAFANYRSLSLLLLYVFKQSLYFKQVLKQSLHIAARLETRQCRQITVTTAATLPLATYQPGRYALPFYFNGRKSLNDPSPPRVGQMGMSDCPGRRVPSLHSQMLQRSMLYPTTLIFSIRVCQGERPDPLQGGSTTWLKSLEPVGCKKQGTIRCGKS